MNCIPRGDTGNPYQATIYHICLPCFSTRALKYEINNKSKQLVRLQVQYFTVLAVPHLKLGHRDVCIVTNFPKICNCQLGYFPQ